MPFGNSLTIKVGHSKFTVAKTVFVLIYDPGFLDVLHFAQGVLGDII